MQHPGLTKPQQQQQEQGHGWWPPHDLRPGWGTGWGDLLEHQSEVPVSMKWGFMLEVSVSLAMLPNLLAWPARLLLQEGGT